MEQLWKHVWSLKRGVRPKAFIAIWFRGGTKSTTCEMAVCALAAMDKRKYALYVSESQDQADDHVANIAAMLESPRFAVYYPKVAARKLSKYGHSRGWRRNRLRTASGFTIDAIGLDTAARGAKMEEERPDLMIIDDIDNEHDTKAAVDRKVKSLTRKLIPAGSDDLAVIGIQNLVHQDSIFNQIVDGRADFLTERIVSGPIPAIENLEYEQHDGHYIVTGGQPTWSGADLDLCEAFIADWGLSAFLNEAQHSVEAPPGGMFDHLIFQHVDFIDIAPNLIRTVVWVDPAVSDTDRSDSHAISVMGIDRQGKIYAIYQWEHRASPLESLTRALKAALRFNADCIGVETDQGGDTWESVYREAVKAVEAELGVVVRVPFKAEKAGSIGSKTHRASQMLVDYENDMIRHCRGTHEVLEKALRRFPRTKPFDLVDAEFWSWYDLVTLQIPDSVLEYDERVVISPV